ncbi:MAG: hypothetical protein OXK77_07615 [Gemmatimonadota bacterium]|nr:hypothetical protein [Gemmatimonadota bacterium]MDE2865902.1 hypothetical protein [Gemmatimonadota bacterium]MXV94417.1 hypothetical protein [Gemmatimonadota bacterium]MYB07687.1 hypothetical protein [Gemmatimonadota bacterium]MYE15125.1 hypothetical protein [Gemmatimonadota bacterium]
MKPRTALSAVQPSVDLDDGPGVPEAIPRTVHELGRRLGAASIDRLWIFPPLIRGRREWGLVAASSFEGQKARRLVTARYSARRTGKGLFLDARYLDQGVAPADRLPRVMEGVVRRGPAPLGGPRLVEVGGDSAAFDAFMKEFGDELFEEAVKGRS